MVRRMCPVDEQSQRLIEAAHKGEAQDVVQALGNPLVDVNYSGTVCLRVKCSEIVLHEESADEVRIGYDEFRTDVTALFVAAHSGHVDLVRRLLLAGADVNQKLFRGYATTAAAREGHHEILGILIKAGASQPACEEALLEACRSGLAEAAKLLINSEMIRPSIAVHGLVQACCRGFVDVVQTLIENGVNANSWDRALLQSAKPALHANLDCTPLIAAIISRQISIVKLLLEHGVDTDCRVNLGAWAWDSILGEELRVGAGLAEPYNAAWCAVEYYESSGTILRLLLKHLSPDSEHRRRTLIFHAILCQNVGAIKVLLEAGANAEFCTRTMNGQEYRALHMAARKGNLSILKELAKYGCDLDATTETGDTALMLCLRLDHPECFKELLISGADLSKVNKDGEHVLSIAESNLLISFLQEVVSNAIVSGKAITSSNMQVFSHLHFMSRFGDSKALQNLLLRSCSNLNLLDDNGFSAVMIAAKEGHVDAFKLLVFAGADLGLKNKKGESAVRMALAHPRREQFEKVMLDASLALNVKCEDFKALHYAARKGDIESTRELLSRAYAMNSLDEDGYTPLMLAAIQGHAEACKVLIQAGADCGIINLRGDTALSLARSNSSRLAEGVILDHLAGKLVLAGDQLCKHTKQGRGKPHIKTVKMLKSGLFSWGKSARRNIYLKEAVLGPSPGFRRNRGKATDSFDGVFRIVSVKKREIHFQGRNQASAEIWVRGINLTVKEAAFSKCRTSHF